jgi:translation initiation factor 1
LELRNSGKNRLTIPCVPDFQIHGMSSEEKIPTDGGQSLAQNPFGALGSAGLPSFAKVAPGKPVGQPATPARNRGRVDLKRTTAGRGGKTVTIVTGFTGIGLPEKEALAKKMRSACGCGGTVKDGDIEIQGDQRETIARILTEAGFRPVFAGG